MRIGRRFLLLHGAAGAALAPFRGAAMSPDPFLYQPHEETFELEVPPGQYRDFLEIDFRDHPDPAAILVTISNKGNHDSGLMNHPISPNSQLIVRPGHRETARLLCPEDRSIPIQWWYPGTRRARLNVTLHGVWVYR